MVVFVERDIISGDITVRVPKVLSNPMKISSDNAKTFYNNGDKFKYKGRNENGNLEIYEGIIPYNVFLDIRDEYAREQKGKGYT